MAGKIFGADRNERDDASMLGDYFSRVFFFPSFLIINAVVDLWKCRFLRMGFGSKWQLICN